MFSCRPASSSAAVQGCSTAVQGCSAAVQGYSAAVQGCSTAVQGCSAAVQGCSAAIQGPFKVFTTQYTLYIEMQVCNFNTFYHGIFWKWSILFIGDKSFRKPIKRKYSCYKYWNSDYLRSLTIKCPCPDSIRLLFWHK